MLNEVAANASASTGKLLFSDAALRNVDTYVHVVIAFAKVNRYSQAQIKSRSPSRKMPTHHTASPSASYTPASIQTAPEPPPPAVAAPSSPWSAPCIRDSTQTSTSTSWLTSAVASWASATSLVSSIPNLSSTSHFPHFHLRGLSIIHEPHPRRLRQPRRLPAQRLGQSMTSAPLRLMRWNAGLAYTASSRAPRFQAPAIKSLIHPCRKLLLVDVPPGKTPP